MSRILIALAPIALATTAYAAPQGIDARSNSMGGAQVSSADYRNAGFANPALLTQRDEDDDWGLVLPTVSARIGDPDDLVSSAEDFVDELDRIEAAGVATAPELLALGNQLLDLDNRTLVADVGAGLAFAIPSDTFGFSFVVDSRLTARSFVDVDPNDLAAIAAGGGVLPDLNSNAVVTGAMETNYGGSVARAFDFFGRKLSVGVTPKIQRVETFNYRVAADDFEEDEQQEDFDDPIFRSDDTDFNVDAGLLLEALPNVTIGLSGRNLVSRDIPSVTTLGESFTYQVEPVATIGASVDLGRLTLAADYDLTRTEPLDFAPGSQFIGGGAEIAFEWTQLRVGYRADIEDVVNDTFTFGIGLSPFDTLHIDIGGAYGDDTYGAFVQLGFTF